MTSYYANVRKHLYQSWFGFFFPCVISNVQHKTSLNSSTGAQGFSWGESPADSWGSVWNTNTPALLSSGWVRWTEQGPHLLKHLPPCGWSIHLQWHNFVKLHCSQCSPGWFRRADVLTSHTTNQAHPSILTGLFLCTLTCTISSPEL